MRVAMLGPPGSGKGTQAERLSGVISAVHISTGELLREAIAEGSPLGRKAESYVSSGRLAPDELVLGLIEDRLRSGAGASGFLLDGFPRNTPQAEGLDKLLSRLGIDLEHVLYISVPDEVAVERLTARRVCPQCGRNYNLVTMPPKSPGVCDDCGVELEQRADDTEGTIRKRLDVYKRETEPIIDYYRNKRVLVDVDGRGSADVTFRNILAGLGLSGHGQETKSV